MAVQFSFLVITNQSFNFLFARFVLHGTMIIRIQDGMDIRLR